MTGQVEAIFICADKGLPMTGVGCIQAVEYSGLKGDRYQIGIEKGAWSHAKGDKTRHVTLISQEAINAANTENGTNFLSSETRRNIVVSGIDLNDLVGREFKVGPVRMRGIELADPCDRPSSLSGKSGFKEAFKDRGGLRAQIITSGVICLYDLVLKA